MTNVYIGDWLNGKRTNEGQQFYRDGIYVGNFVNDQRSGLGIMWLDENSSAYMGEWENDKYNGVGIFFDGIYL